MAKVSLPPITNAQNLSAINNNFSAIADALNNGTLWRDNPVGEPNEIDNDIDFNGNNLLNGGTATFTDITVNGMSVSASVSQAGAYALQAQGYANQSASSAAQAATSASQAAASAASIHIPIVVSSGGTGVTSASGIALDNITGFSSLGYLKRTAPGVYSQVATIPIADGGTGATTQAGALTAILGASSVPIANGGTNATTASGARTNLGLGTAAVANTGTSGGVVPFLNGNNTWGAPQIFTNPGTYAGVVSGVNPSSGNIGEYVTAVSASSGLTSGSNLTIQTLSLSAGIWDVENVTVFTPGSGCTGTTFLTSVSLTNNAQGPSTNTNCMTGVNVTNSIGNFPFKSGQARIALSGTTTVYGVVLSVFSGGTMTCVTTMVARRVA